MREKVFLKASPTGPSFKAAVVIVEWQFASRTLLDTADQVFFNCLMDRKKMMHAELTNATKNEEKMRVVL
jgi:hypothetical protein